jgi:hypothetical protein
VIGGIRITLLGKGTPQTIGLSEISHLRSLQTLLELIRREPPNEQQQQDKTDCVAAPGGKPHADTI